MLRQSPVLASVPATEHDRTEHNKAIILAVQWHTPPFSVSVDPSTICLSPQCWEQDHSSPLPSESAVGTSRATPSDMEPHLIPTKRVAEGPEKDNRALPGLFRLKTLAPRAPSINPRNKNVATNARAAAMGAWREEQLYETSSTRPTPSASSRATWTLPRGSRSELLRSGALRLGLVHAEHDLVWRSPAGKDQSSNPTKQPDGTLVI